ncbi:nickel pincer cofactor biosynthesis protein LarC [Flavobacteriaceae bacterium F89]|uniref:Putative nickel insertion protein n=1 Tax=Cerina litoralis TaxID=2874477 RepID=A0AAE3EY10_9FLAO|nr:nickel pincer cofactor biosynthesis protein LarC [Cerina litoralis]MCG2462219.1 nickel pincer cofactor biosynthesis protein LarC [Cerina litoralis]
MATLYIEGFSGMSGDMFLGALAGLTDSYDELRDLPKLLSLDDAEIKITQVDKNGIVCQHVSVVDLNEQRTKHDDNHDHHHHHGHSHGHSHEKGHPHGHSHRHLSDINKIIDHASIEDGAKAIAKAIFLIIGQSESKIHNIPLEKIHFHEVSGVDSIIDIVGCSMLLHKLDIEKSYATAVCTGYGFVDTQHGKLPVPAPATADILTGIPCYAGEEAGERVTPTGAAILKYLDPDFDVPVLITKKTVYGPGSKDFIAPNVLRLSICEVGEKRAQDYILETNIDDMSYEFLGNDFQEGLFAHGADDFHYNPIHMKKGRPGILLSCSVAGDRMQQLSDYILESTSTIGVRSYPIEKNKLHRESKKFQTTYGEVQVKIATTPSGAKRAKIEFDDLRRLSKEVGKPIVFLQNELMKIIDEHLVNH